MRAVQIGVGGSAFGGTWRQGLTLESGIEVVGLVDRNPEHLEEARIYYGLPAESCSRHATKEFYEQVQADFIIDSTPHSLHYKHALEALRLGMNVIVVKPMSDSITTAATMVREAERLGKKLIVAQQLRFMSPVLELKQRIEQGEIGDVAYIQVDSFFGRSGPVREKWYQPHPLLLECAIHQLDLIRWITGLEAESVIADSWNMPWNEDVWGTKTATAIFRMNNGSRAMYRGLSTAQQGENYPGSWVIEGTEGVLALKNGTIYREGRRIWPEEPSNGTQLDLASLNAAVLKDAIAYFTGKSTSVLTGADNLSSLKMAFACIESSEREERIKICT